MFSGIIEITGTVAGVRPAAGGSMDLSLEAPFPDPPPAAGESVAVNGCCLTVTRREGIRLDVQISPETLDCTNLGGLMPGRRVNLERSLQLNGRIGGHLVTGHVDAAGVIDRIEARPDFWKIRVRCAKKLRELLVEKGSVAVDGVSLTVNRVLADGFEVGIIRHTLGVTTLSERKAGDAVNLEADLIGKYVRRLLEPYRGQLERGGRRRT